MSRSMVMLGAVWMLAAAGLGAISLISVEQEIALGREANAQVQREVPSLQERTVLGYVRDIGARLVARSQGEAYPYSFHVADYRELNAFALPGGPVWIHRGLLEAATRESQVAAVLAHEIAHISERHAADQASKSLIANLGLGLLGAILGNGTSATTTRMAAGLLANGVFLKFSRDDEREADRVGMALMARAGWDSRGMIELLEILEREAARNPGQVATFLSTHPSPEDRIARLRASDGHGGTRDSGRFRDVRARLRRLPPASSMSRN
ncbi:MAG: hypothetical protein FJW23_10200 [Acidimicrobiia bacterium]|nr:hypothetical protein [Acidimicrobiia bacterium]